MVVSILVLMVVVLFIAFVTAAVIACKWRDRYDDVDSEWESIVFDRDTEIRQLKVDLAKSNRIGFHRQSVLERIACLADYEDAEHGKVTSKGPTAKSTPLHTDAGRNQSSVSSHAS